MPNCIFTDSITVKIKKLSDTYRDISAADSLETLSIKNRLLIAHKLSTLDKLAVLMLDKGGSQEVLFENLKQFFHDQWDLINGTCLCYTVMPHDDLTQLLIDVLTTALISYESNENALTIMMPGLTVDSASDNYPDLVLSDVSKDSFESKLISILQSHILADSGRYLIPVTLLAELDVPFRPNRLFNPYFDFSNHTEAEAIISQNEYLRLSTHSSDSQELVVALDNLESIKNDDQTLLGYITRFYNSLTFNSSSGVGVETNAGNGAYSAIIIFYNYYISLSNEVKRKIPTPITDELELLLNLSSDKTKNIDATATLATCVNTRRIKLKNYIDLYHNELQALNKLTGANDSGRQAAIEQIQQCKKGLISLPNGADKLGLTLALLKTYNIKVEFDTLDFYDLMTFEINEIESILSSETNANKFKALFIHFDDLIMFFHAINRLDKFKFMLNFFKEVIFTEFVTYFEDVSMLLISFDLERFEIMCEHFKAEFTSIIIQQDQLSISGSFDQFSFEQALILLRTFPECWSVQTLNELIEKNVHQAEIIFTVLNPNLTPKDAGVKLKEIFYIRSLLAQYTSFNQLVLTNYIVTLSQDESICNEFLQHINLKDWEFLICHAELNKIEPILINFLSIQHEITYLLDLFFKRAALENRDCKPFFQALCQLDKSKVLIIEVLMLILDSNCFFNDPEGFTLILDTFRTEFSTSTLLDVIRPYVAPSYLESLYKFFDIDSFKLLFKSGFKFITTLAQLNSYLDFNYSHPDLLLTFSSIPTEIIADDTDFIKTLQGEWYAPDLRSTSEFKDFIAETCLPSLLSQAASYKNLHAELDLFSICKSLDPLLLDLLVKKSFLYCETLFELKLLVDFYNANDNRLRDACIYSVVFRPAVIDFIELINSTWYDQHPELSSAIIHCLGPKTKDDLIAFIEKSTALCTPAIQATFNRLNSGFLHQKLNELASCGLLKIDENLLTNLITSDWFDNKLEYFKFIVRAGTQYLMFNLRLVPFINGLCPSKQAVVIREISVRSLDMIVRDWCQSVITVTQFTILHRARQDYELKFTPEISNYTVDAFLVRLKTGVAQHNRRYFELLVNTYLPSIKLTVYRKTLLQRINCHENIDQNLMLLIWRAMDLNTLRSFCTDDGFFKAMYQNLLDEETRCEAITFHYNILQQIGRENKSSCTFLRDLLRPLCYSRQQSQATTLPLLPPIPNLHNLIDELNHVRHIVYNDPVITCHLSTIKKHDDLLTILKEVKFIRNLDQFFDNYNYNLCAYEYSYEQLIELHELFRKKSIKFGVMADFFKKRVANFFSRPPEFMLDFIIQLFNSNDDFYTIIKNTLFDFLAFWIPNLDNLEYFLKAIPPSRRVDGMAAFYDFLEQKPDNKLSKTAKDFIEIDYLLDDKCRIMRDKIIFRNLINNILFKDENPHYLVIRRELWTSLKKAAGLFYITETNRSRNFEAFSERCKKALDKAHNALPELTSFQLFSHVLLTFLSLGAASLNSGKDDTTSINSCKNTFFHPSGKEKFYHYCASLDTILKNNR